LADAGEPAHPTTKIRALIDPGINGRPGTRCAIDPDEISAPYDLVESSKCFRKQVAAFDGRVGRYLRESVANSTRGAVMSFAETGGKNENFFHDGNGAGEFNGILRRAKYTWA